MRRPALVALLWILSLVPALTWAQQYVIPAGREALIQGLLADVGVDVPLEGGLSFDRTRVTGASVLYDLRTTTDQRVVATVRLSHISAAEPGDTKTAHFAVKVEPATASSHPLVVRALQSVAAHDTDQLFARTQSRKAGSRPPGWRPDWQWASLGLLIALGLLVVALLWRRLTRRPPATVEFYFKPTHALPAVLQTVIFMYWALYYRELADYLPAIALQILFCFVLEAAIAFATGPRWRASFGPIPVTLSTNLFVLFTYGQGYLTLLALTLALLSKRWIRRGGRHVLNPSAFGTGVVGVLTLLFPSLGYGDSAYQFALAPNMTELVLLLALIVQLRVPVVLVSASAVVGLLLVGAVTGRISFSPFWAPVTLVLVLLATDPATSPKTAGGRVLYGLSVGVLMRICGSTLEHLYDHDFYGKVLGVLLANTLVPWFDHLAARAPTRLGWLQPRFNRAHVALWFVVMAWSVGAGGHKGKDLTSCKGCQGAHHDNRTRFIRFGRGRAVACEDNPLFCNGFSFAQEWRCWARSDGPTGARCGGGRPHPRRP